MIDNIIKNRATVISSDFNYLYLTENSKEFISYVIVPIIINGDVFGAIMIFSETTNIGEFEKIIANNTAKFLSKYIE